MRLAAEKTSDCLAWTSPLLDERNLCEKDEPLNRNLTLLAHCRSAMLLTRAIAASLSASTTGGPCLVRHYHVHGPAYGCRASGIERVYKYHMIFNLDIFKHGFPVASQLSELLSTRCFHASPSPTKAQ